MFSGSLDFFSDAFFLSPVEKSVGGGKKYAKSGNQALAANLARWCFKQAGVLRVTGVSHHLKGEKGLPAEGKNQVWSLTQLYSVDFSKARIGVRKCIFNKRTIKVSGSCF